MSEIIKEHPNKAAISTSTCNYNVMITTLTCSILIVLVAVCFRPTSDDGGGDGYDPSDTLAQKVAKLEKRNDAISKALEDKDNKCLNPTVSSLQRDFPVDCAEIYDRGIRQDGVYHISPDGKCPFPEYCDMVNGGWTLIQRHTDGKLNFYRPWDDYVKGFGNLEADHWLGLDKIHRLTKSGSQVYFHMENYDGTFEYAHYQAFTVHDVTTAYRMNVDVFGYKGTLRELLGVHDNMKFSTFDRDNDIRSGGNCCKDELDGGGFWYANCWHFNPNGVFGKRGFGGIAYFDGGVKSVKTFLIKVKRRQGLC